VTADGERITPGGTLVWDVGIQKAKAVVVNEKERVEAVRLIDCLATVGGGGESGRSDELPLTTDNPFLRHNALSSRTV